MRPKGRCIRVGDSISYKDEKSSFITIIAFTNYLILGIPCAFNPPLSGQHADLGIMKCHKRHTFNLQRRGRTAGTCTRIKSTANSFKPRYAGRLESCMRTFFLPTDEISAINLRKKLDVDDPDRDDPDLYTLQNKDGKGVFRLPLERVYETGRATAPDPDHAYKEVVLALHDPEPGAITSQESSTGRLKKAAYYYPVMQKFQLKPHRSKNLAQLGVAPRAGDEEDDKKIDALEVVVEDLDKLEMGRRATHRAGLLGEAIDEDEAQASDT